jgi:hypothetical protein
MTKSSRQPGDLNRNGQQLIEKTDRPGELRAGFVVDANETELTFPFGD